MNFTKEHLKEIIKEELENILKEKDRRDAGQRYDLPVERQREICRSRSRRGERVHFNEKTKRCEYDYLDNPDDPRNFLQEENAYYEMLAEGENIEEAMYKGRKVKLNKPMRGDVKKSKVYVKNAKGNVVKVNFGDKNMKIKKSNPKRRKSFRARHNCKNPGPKWKARYWSCKAW